MPRWVLHVDMDAFFASVEQVLDPTLAGRPVIVCGRAEERGVVSAASYEARRYGVRSAMPTAQAKRLCPEGVFVSANHRAYREYSRRVLGVLKRFTPLFEQTSVDEAYLDITGCEKLLGGPVAAARKVKEAVRAETGLTCSVGVAPNRLLAKMGSEMQKPDGLTLIRVEDVPGLIWPLPVGRLHGVGPRTAARLRALGLQTIGDLARYPVDLLVREFGVAGRHLHDAANGRDETPVTPPDEAGAPKSLSRETTFSRDVDDAEELERALLALSEDVASRLRREGYRGRTVTVKIRRADFSTVTRSRTLGTPTDLTEEIYEAARSAFASWWRPSVRIRLLGVGVTNLETGGDGPRTLFDPREKLQRVSRAVDRIRNRYGERSVVRARLLSGSRDGPPNDTGRERGERS
ncbi:MAG TPA: DNA polymerase IV [Clostridiales bacterium]|nr:DNA polymerase IV [Clostridiales bacterium]